MRRYWLLLALYVSSSSISLGLPLAQTTKEALPADTTLTALESRCIQIFNTHASAIVRVRGAYSQPSEDGSPKIALQIGSGFFINQEGEVLTTATVAANADRVWIEHAGAKYPAKCCGTDPETNITLLKVLEPPRHFTCIPIPIDSTEPLIGSMVFGVTCPLECKPSPSQGWILGYDGEYGGHLFPTYHLRVSLGNYPGEGGSPVFDANGRFIGIIVYTATALNASYLLPAQALLHVRDSIRSQGKVSHGYVGIVISPVESIGEPPKIVISEVAPGSPAADAGLRRGDELLRVNKRPIHEMTDVRQAAFFVHPGQFVPIDIRRNDSIQTLTVHVAAIPKNLTDNIAPAP